MNSPAGIFRGSIAIIRRIPFVLEHSAKARRSILALMGVLAYLLIGQAIDPGFTHYWWYQIIQTTATLLVVILAETIFFDEGGLAWQTHLIIVITTLADTLGTAGHLYDKIGPYDKVVHFASGAAFAAGSFEILGYLRARGVIDISLDRQCVLAVAVSFAIAGVAWETYEQVSDFMFSSGRVNGKWDTIHDLVSDACGAITAVLILRWKTHRLAIRESLVPDVGQT